MTANPPPYPARRPPDWVWLAFLLWTAVGFVVMPFGVGEAGTVPWLPPGPLKTAFAAVLHRADAIWILLAAANLYLYAAQAEGLRTARIWAAIILISSTAFEWIGTRTDFPFGPYVYTDNFGWRILGVVPLAIPLAWLVVILGGRYLVLWLRPTASPLELASGTAVLAVSMDLNLEYVAWKVRSYWVWYPASSGVPPHWPPWQNYLSWFVLSFALAWALPANHDLRFNRPGPRKPLLVLGLMNALLALVHLLR